MDCGTDQHMYHLVTSVSEDLDLNNRPSRNIFLGVSSSVIYRTVAIPGNKGLILPPY